MKNVDDLDKKKIIIVLGIIIIAILTTLIIINQRAAKSLKKLDNAVKVVTPENNSTAPKTKSTTTIDQFQVEMPKDVKVPEPNEKLSGTQKAEIAVPTISIPAGPGTATNFRSFEITAEGNKFTPTKIIVNRGDTIHINFKAVDKDYDIILKSYNLRQTALKGETKVLEFQAVQAGDYIYYCERCGGINGTARGEIIIVKK
ncbi:MAG: cupredoxin domain-containing protein [Patescibacteria group bacterium]